MLEANTKKKTKALREYFSTSWPSDHLRILSLIQATWVSRLIYFAVKNEIFEKVIEGNNTLELLSKSLNLDQSTTKRIVKGLEHLELILDSGGNLNIPNLGKLLSRNTSGNLAHMCLLWGEEFGNAWQHLSEAVYNDTTGFEIFYKERIFEYFKKNKTSSENFDYAMDSISQLLYPAVIEKLDLSNVSSLVDVGGGKGNLINLISKSNPHVNCTLFDLDYAIENAKCKLGNDAKLNFVAGDFFNNVPKADSHIMSNILHDWNDEKSVIILTNIRKAQPESGRLFILEMAIDHDKEPILARSTDLNMLVFTGGRERSFEEFKKLLKQCGFILETLVNIKDMTCLLTAKAI